MKKKKKETRMIMIIIRFILSPSSRYLQPLGILQIHDSSTTHSGCPSTITAISRLEPEPAIFSTWPFERTDNIFF